MVRLKEWLKKINWVRFKYKKREKKVRHKHWETVRVFDEIAGHPWSSMMPLSILKEHLPLSCRYTFELASARYIAMALFGVVSFILVFLSLFFVGISLLVQAILAIIVGFIGVLIGYVKGYVLFIEPPVWIVRRLYARTMSNDTKPEDIDDPTTLPIDYDSFPIIIPIEHTKLTGFPMAVAAKEREASALISIQVMKQQASNMNGAASGGEGYTPTITTMDRLNLAAAYSPRAFRASSMYEILMARAVKSIMRSRKGKNSARQAFIMGAGTALVAIGILIFAMLIFGE